MQGVGLVPCFFHQLPPKATTNNARRSLQERTPACPMWALRLTARLLPVFSPTHASRAPRAHCLLPLLVILLGLQQAAPHLPPQGLWRPPFCLESQVQPSGKFPRSMPDLPLCLRPQRSEGAGSHLTSLSAPPLLLSPEFSCGFVLVSSYLGQGRRPSGSHGGVRSAGSLIFTGPQHASIGTPFVSGTRQAALRHDISVPSVVATGHPCCQIRKLHLRDLVTG